MFARSAIPSWSVWLCFPLTIALAVVINSCQLPIIEPDLQQIPSYKFTFISVLLALGAFQYNMFVTIAERFRKIIDDEDFNPSWREYKQKTEELRIKILANPANSELLQWLEDLELRDKQINDYVDWHRTSLPKVLIEASIRFVLIFSVGLGLLLSLWMDILELLGMRILLIDFDNVAMSQSFLFAALILFAVLYCFYILAFSIELVTRMPSSNPVE